MSILQALCCSFIIPAWVLFFLARSRAIESFEKQRRDRQFEGRMKMAKAAGAVFHGTFDVLIQEPKNRPDEHL